MRNIFVNGILFLIIFLIFILNASGNIESIDGLASLNMARNFVYHGTWNVAPPEYNLGMAAERSLVDNKYYIGASKGYAVAMMPAVLITKYIYDKNGFTPINRFPLESDYLLTFLASFINPILGFVLFVVMYLILKFISKKEGISFVLAAVMSLSTNLLVLSKHSFVHILFTLLVMIGFYGLIRFLDNKKQLGWLGLIIIDLVLLKYSYNFTFILPLVVLYLFVWFWVVSKWSIKIFSLFVIVSIILVFVGFEFLGLNWSLIQGMIVGEGTRRDMFQSMWGQLLSPGRSLFVYSPILVLSMYWSFRNFKNVYSKLFLLMVFVYVGFYSLFDIWHGELSYGPRYLSVIIPFGILVLGINWKSINKWVLGALVVLGLYVQLVGVTVPYETEYQGISFLNYSEADIVTRQDQFDYWSLGEFYPRFSPIYRLKRNFVHRLILVKNIFGQDADFTFAGGATLPFDGDKIFRRIGNNFKIYSKNNITFDNVIINNITKDVIGLDVCINSFCQTSKPNYIGDKINFKFDNEFVANGDNIEFILKTRVNGQRYELTEVRLGNNVVSNSSYKLLLEDSFYNVNTLKTIDSKVLFERYYDYRSVANMTADFWWVKVLIYENLPQIFRTGSHVVFGLFGISVLILGIDQINQLFFKTVKSKKLR